MASDMRANFFFATSALFELATLATFFLGLQNPTDYVAARAFCSSVFLGFDRLSIFIAFWSSRVVHVAMEEHQRCREVFPPSPGHAFEHLVMQDVANVTCILKIHTPSTILSR